ncbi:MAG: hypothetical protein R2911_29855 [Caldilineaceae bacterium]
MWTARPASSLLVAGLQALAEPGRGCFHVPNRFTESHASAAMLQKMAGR